MEGWMEVSYRLRIGPHLGTPQGRSDTRQTNLHRGMQSHFVGKPATEMDGGCLQSELDSYLPFLHCIMVGCQLWLLERLCVRHITRREEEPMCDVLDAVSPQTGSTLN
jgi:hypothetical protein